MFVEWLCSLGECAVDLVESSSGDQGEHNCDAEGDHGPQRAFGDVLLVHVVVVSRVGLEIVVEGARLPPSVARDDDGNDGCEEGPEGELVLAVIASRGEDEVVDDAHEKGGTHCPHC